MPFGRRHRIVKPRSERQQEHSADFSTRPENVINLLPANTGHSDRSWWTDASSWEDFSARVAQEQARIVTSKFARTMGAARLGS